MSLARFSVRNRVPVNLLMFAAIVGGLFAAGSLRREFFPESDPEVVIVSLRYPGATPAEVEQGLALKVEDALAELNEVDEIRTDVAEGGGGVTAELREGVEPEKGLDEVERAVDRLTDLPEGAEQLEVRLREHRIPVIRTAVYGPLDERTRKRAIRAVRRDLRSLPGMGEVRVAGVRDYEIRIDVRPEALTAHRLSLPEVADAVRKAMREVPGGTVRTRGGEIHVRAMGAAEAPKAIREIVVAATPEGGALRLHEIAAVRFGFVDERVYSRYQGQPSAEATIYKVGEQDIIRMARMVRAYVAGRNGDALAPGPLERLALERTWGFLAPVLGADAPARIASALATPRVRAWRLGAGSPRPLPPEAKLAYHSDYSRFVQGRLELLLRNAAYGACLVFATLLLFLNWRVAFWVGVGLTTALLGTLILMRAADVTLNLLTMFGLIVVLGLLVDDAIVVSENIQRHHDRGTPALAAAVTGTHEVFWPVVATVLTSVVAFLPLSYIRGRIGDLVGALPVVVACALVMSLLESVLILPNHMGHTLDRRDRYQPGALGRLARRLEAARDRLLLRRLVPAFGRLLGRLLRWRYATVAGALAALLAAGGLVRGGYVVYEFLPASDAESIVVDLRMPIGTPAATTNALAKRVERVARTQPEARGVATLVGQRRNLETGQIEAAAPHLAQVLVELTPVQRRDLPSYEVVDRIREPLDEVIRRSEKLRFQQITGGPAGPDISLRVSGGARERRRAAATAIQRELARFAATAEIGDDENLGKLERRIHLRPGARALGLTPAGLAEQVRGFLHGVEAHVFAAKEEDIDVRVRLAPEARRDLAAIEHAWVFPPRGPPVPMSQVARIEQVTTRATIQRVNRQRAITVTAETEAGVSPERVMSAFPLSRIRARFADLEIELAGRQQRQREAFASLPWGALAALGMIYLILAWLFASYLQPLTVLAVVPFTLIGVVLGHMALGYKMTFLSLIGFVALTGIVVNDSLILVRFYNDRRLAGKGPFSGLIAAGRARLRAIVLTTVTTVLGLTPLMLERSFQAKFLIPMAISIAMGLLSATVVVLIVLPCFLLIFEDARRAAVAALRPYWDGRDGARAWKE